VRLEELAVLGRPMGRSTLWPEDSRGRPDPGAMSASWCNGAAGLVPLWLAAHDMLGGDRHLARAMASAWTAYEIPHPATADLCCGLAGRAYALAALHRRTADPAWLDRARHLADRAMAVEQRDFRADSLYKGTVGVALLTEELITPTPAGLPFYEPEGWPGRPPQGQP
jgi:serine/threonine-protein kinase